MRRIALFLAPLLMVLGLVAIPTPAEADTVTGATSRAICIMGEGNMPHEWSLFSYHTVHYGSAHITQCEYHYLSQTWGPAFCAQYVWNIPNPYWSSYAPEPQGSALPLCW